MADVTTGAGGLTPQEAPTKIGKFLLNWQNKIEIAKIKLKIT